MEKQLAGSIVQNQSFPSSLPFLLTFKFIIFLDFFLSHCSLVSPLGYVLLRTVAFLSTRTRILYFHLFVSLMRKLRLKSTVICSQSLSQLHRSLRQSPAQSSAPRTRLPLRVRKKSWRDTFSLLFFPKWEPLSPTSLNFKLFALWNSISIQPSIIVTHCQFFLLSFLHTLL